MECFPINRRRSGPRRILFAGIKVLPIRTAMVVVS